MSPKTSFKRALDHALAGPAPAATTRALAGLRRRLQAELPPALWYDQLPDTPVGPLWVAVSAAGLAGVHYGAEPGGWLAGLRQRGFAEPERSAARTAPARRALLDYLAGRRQDFTEAVDWRGVSAFQRLVLEAADRIPRGRVLTYQALAERLGRPRAARAVGQALRRNPAPIILPCHRVVAANGDLRGYLGKHGVKTKAWLLALEGARL